MMVGSHMGPDPAMADRVHPLPMLGCLAPVIQAEAVVRSVANRSTWGWCHRKHITRKELWQEGPFCLDGLA